MNAKSITGILIIVIFLVVGFFSFSESKIEYSNFHKASENHKTCQVKGNWVKDKEAKFDANTNEFIFYMMDENNTEMKVILAGSRPNNFEMAESVVAKGKMKDGNFYAKEVLTKCPSKYEGKGEDVKKSGI
ncbi:MAG TPA: cytochrome c maturation protein CcmE [Ignavibacteria bacterium]|mgnify:FL=1|nr:cytochrome c maturation protein CcmE [Ignavibacteria bacterium]